MKNHSHGNTISFLKKHVLLGLLLVMASSTLTGCLSTGGGGSSGGSSGGSQTPGSCDQPYLMTVTPDKIEGESKLYFSIDKFSFLNDPKILISSIELKVTFKGKKKKTDEVLLSLNGVKSSRKDGGKSLEWLDDSHGQFSLHKMFLNGADPFDTLMLKIKKNKGYLRIKLHADDARIIEASLSFIGTTYQQCQQPTPTPTPTPIVKPTIPTVTLDSVQPSQSSTASTSISFSFSSAQAGVQFWCSLDGAAASSCASPKAYSGLASGNHSFSVYATNSANQAGAAVSYSWSIDNVSPSVTIDNVSQLPTLTNNTSISLSFSSSKAGSTFTCSIDGATALACVSPITYSSLTEGAHNFSVNALDSLGNAAANPATFQWSIDTTAPVASFESISPSTAISNASSRSFTFVANENSTFECSVDNGAFSSCTSPVSLDSLSEGTHWFEVRATDLAGNQGIPASTSWVVDLTAPQLSLGAVSPQAGLSNAQNISVEFFTNESANVTCSFDGAAATSCTSPYALQAVSEGQHSLVISATDFAGNVSQPVQIDWTLDRTAPVISFGQILPSASSYLNSSNVTLNVNDTKDASLTVTVNGVSQVMASPIALNNLGEGSYDVSVVATDAAGNSSNTIDYQFVVDLTAPTLSLSVQNTQSPINIDNNTFTMTASEEVTYQCNVDAIGFELCANPLSLSGLADGDHTVQIQAVDLAGNLSDVASYSWTIDTTAPTTTISTLQTAYNAFNFSLSANEATTGFICSIDGQPEYNCSSTPSLSSLSTGSHVFVAKAIDLAGNLDSVGASYQLNVGLPIQTMIGSASPSSVLTNQTSMTLVFSANQLTSGYQCSLDGNASVICASPWTVSGLSQGQHVIKVQAVDQFGGLDPIGASYSWTIDTQPPTTGLSVNQVNSSISFSLTSSEAGVFVCSLDGSAFASCATSVSYSGVAPGSHSFTAKAIDNAGNTDPVGATYSFTVLPPIQTFLAGVSLSSNPTNQTSIGFTLSANQTASSYLCSLDGAAAVSCGASVSYSGLANGTHTFLGKAVDQWGSADATGVTYSWTVDTVPPALVSISPTVSTNSITVTWTTNEPSTSQLRYGIGSNLNQLTAENSAYTTSHSIKITGLSSNTLYSFQIISRDAAGNVYQGTPTVVRTSR